MAQERSLLQGKGGSFKARVEVALFATPLLRRKANDLLGQVPGWDSAELGSVLP